MKARSIGLLAEDYINDKVTDLSLFGEHHQTLSGFDATVIDRLYNDPAGIPFDEIELESPLNPNDCFVMKNGKRVPLHAMIHSTGVSVKSKSKSASVYSLVMQSKLLLLKSSPTPMSN